MSKDRLTRVTLWALAMVVIGVSATDPLDAMGTALALTLVLFAAGS